MKEGASTETSHAYTHGRLRDRDAITCSQPLLITAAKRSMQQFHKWVTKTPGGATTGVGQEVQAIASNNVLLTVSSLQQ